MLILLLFFFQAPNPRLPTTSQLPGQSHVSHDQPDEGPTIPPPVPVVGKLTVKGKFDFTSVSLVILYLYSICTWKYFSLYNDITMIKDPGLECPTRAL